MFKYAKQAFITTQKNTVFTTVYIVEELFHCQINVFILIFDLNAFQRETGYGISYVIYTSINCGLVYFGLS